LGIFFHAPTVGYLAGNFHNNLGMRIDHLLVAGR